MRGTPGGETPVSQANTEEFRDGYDRTFGNRKPQRGRWVVTPDGLVPIGEYQAPSAEARHAPIMVDRFMEGTAAQDGTDIGSRAKRREYMKRQRVADASDYSKGYFEKRREAKDQALSAAIDRTVVELGKTDTRNLQNAVEHIRRKG